MPSLFPEWDRLREILATIHAQGFKSLSSEEIFEFGRLYRRACAELAFQRTHEADLPRLTFLNDLVGQCYAFVYVAPTHSWPSVWRFFTEGFPRAVRRHALLILLATLISLIPACIGYLVTWHDPAVANEVLPADLMEHMGDIVARHHTPKDWAPLIERAPMASFIMTNNIRISMLAFAGGMTAGILTILLLIYNGLMLGVVGAAVALDGGATALNFWAFVAPHGVLELTSIFISGGAGLLLAYAIINPGTLPRRIALRNAGKEALTLMLGLAATLVVAGTVESFFSPLNIPELIKLTFASIEALLYFSYLLLAGRNAREMPEAPFGTLMTPVPPV